MTAEVLRITDETDRATLVSAIAVLRAKRDRMPEHWVDRRLAIDAQVDDLVDLWLAARS